MYLICLIYFSYPSNSVVFRHAVQNQYKTSLSVARASAGVTGAYDIETCENAYVLGTNEVLKIKVSFKSSPNNRSNKHIDDIHLLSKELIRQVLIEGNDIVII